MSAITLPSFVLNSSIAWARAGTSATRKKIFSAGAVSSLYFSVYVSSEASYPSSSLKKKKIGVKLIKKWMKNLKIKKKIL